MHRDWLTDGLPAGLRPHARGCALLLGTVLAIASGCDAPVDEAPAREGSWATSEQRVVYGEDDRMDVWAHPSEALRTRARQSIVALVPSDRIVFDEEGLLRVPRSTIGDDLGLCEGERFADQPRLATCSGTLIGRDLVLTAGHCVRTEADCKGRSFVFDWFYEAEGVLAPIERGDVYGCGELVTQALDDVSDYAIVRLDRPVTPDRRAAPVRRGDPGISVGAPVSIIGFGSGIPAKIDSGGVVLDTDSDRLNAFRASVDAFGGNSGSGVFDAEGRVVGILVRGATDYVRRGRCSVVNTLPENADERGFGEDVQYAFRAFDSACEREGFDAEFCSGAPDPCEICASESDCDDGALGGPAGAPLRTCNLVDDGPGICATACDEERPCGRGFDCDEGWCSPTARASCLEGGIVTTDYCGRQVAPAVACDAGEVCWDGACEPAAAGDTCETAERLDPVSATRVTTLEPTHSNATRGSCAGGGVERVFTFDLEVSTRIEFLASGLDTVLYVRRACDDPASEAACDDDSDPPGARGSRLRAVLDPGTWYLFVDAWAPAERGDVTLELTFDPRCACDPDDTLCDGADVLRCTPVEDSVCPRPTLETTCGDDELCSGGACMARQRGDFCGDAVSLGEGRTDVGTGSELDDVLASSCAEGRSERFYVLDLPVASRVSIVPNATSIRIVHLSSCTGEELGCDARFEGDLPAGEHLFAVEVASRGISRVDVQVDPLCDDACSTEGETECVDDGVVGACGRDPETGCLAVVPQTVCAPEERCDGVAGVCVAVDGLDAGEGDADAGEGSGDVAPGIVVPDPQRRGRAGDSCSAAPLSGGASAGWLLVLAAGRRRRRHVR